MSGAGTANGPRVAVLIVTHNSASDLAGCFASLAALAGVDFEVMVVDCASADASAEAARRAGAEHGVATRVVALAYNRGFAGGMNAALARTDAPYVLSLNADARPRPDSLAILVETLTRHPAAGAVTGRLVRWRDDGEHGVDTLDACGMRLTLAWRHLDRGSGERERGQYGRAERVFGATGAASLFRRAALDDVAIEGHVFDPAFHSFREDAELAFRFAERGWQVLYEPRAGLRHRRRNLPSRRAEMPPQVNYHSLKNRYLLRAYHQTASNAWLTLLPTLARDAMALAYVLVAERSSLAAYRWLWRHRRQIVQTRRAIQARRTRPAGELNRWFWRDRLPLEPDV